MSQKIDLPATLVKTLAAISAQSGDMLVVYNGQCLGVYKGIDPLQAPLLQKRSYSRYTFDPEKILLILANGPRNVEYIAHALKITPEDIRARKALSNYIRNMAAQGVIKIVPGTKRRHSYEKV
jgi:hypothetical protein